MHAFVILCFSFVFFVLNKPFRTKPLSLKLTPRLNEVDYHQRPMS